MSCYVYEERLSLSNVIEFNLIHVIMRKFVSENVKHFIEIYRCIIIVNEKSSIHVLVIVVNE